MNFISKLFSNKKIECPRCLGKGEVDWDDIKRLNQELKWVPDSCAYCNGKGTVSSNQISEISIDSSYLTTNLPTVERKRFLNNDKGAKARASYFEGQRDDFIAQVEYLHFIGGLTPAKIIDFYNLHLDPSEIDPNDQREFADYVERIIALKRKS